MAQRESFPDAIFGCDEVREAFADLGEACEGGDVAEGDLFEDFDEDFLGNGGDWAWGCGGEVSRWGLALDGEGGEGAD